MKFSAELPSPKTRPYLFNRAGDGIAISPMVYMFEHLVAL